MGFDGGKGGGGLGRNGYRRDVRRWDTWQSDHGNGTYMSAQERVNTLADNPLKGAYGSGVEMNMPPDHKSNGKPYQSADGAGESEESKLARQLADVQQGITQACQEASEKDNEKFDLIFAILVELQNRQAQLEESVRALTAQYGASVGNGGTAPAGSMSQAGAQQHTQFNGTGNGNPGFGPMQGPMNGASMPGQQTMQPFAGAMQPQMFPVVPQVVVVTSPSGGGMQHYTMPQMMSPTGAGGPMPVQLIGVQGDGSEMGHFVGGGAMAPGGGGPPVDGSAEEQQQQGQAPSGDGDAQALQASDGADANAQ